MIWRHPATPGAHPGATPGARPGAYSYPLPPTPAPVSRWPRFVAVSAVHSGNRHKALGS
eukprot:COSAG06_NODE_1183_length_10357_cov_17.781244_8_plen_59_part_00